ncbi:hypothetical protein F3Y22_tig00111640pilonHSYRG00245 [Hibiscus syriacus]|uniref:Myosin-15 n=1 Tax=Hibiscus syriacus TaxID=106335 RepID=A0A6A2XZH7_HIBSY|nr:hypothetical protein F3Y22_tig00111640pilonHSYRG00245 [Hibiscus syriacus]
MLNLAAAKGIFAFHPKCKKIGLTHLSFVDDLLIFCKSNVDSVIGVLSVLDRFYQISGLNLNSSKSELFAAGISSRTLEDLKLFTGFKIGSLPVRYLGIPLVTRKLTAKDCEPLLGKIRQRLQHWSGRLELIRSVLFSVCNFWCRQLILPASILKSVDQLCSRFFWKGADTSTAGARVSWESICLLKYEGGLVSAAHQPIKEVWDKIRIKRMKERNMNLRKGAKVWVEDKNLAWVAAEITDLRGKQVQVQPASGKTVLALPEKVFPRDADEEEEHGGVDDMTKLTYLNEPGVLYNLQRRYALNDIYTYTGSILIAVNPFTKLPHLYNVHMMEQYRGAPFGELSPHVFAVADVSYRAMMNEGRSQSILVSGESGAGKTETTKLIMQYLTFVGGRTAGDDRTVEQQVLESNPLLEAFGNARTVRNDNSSRFGKFVEIQFDANGRISGAAVRTYLLERSRVVQITDPERNYHCFYQLCASGKSAALSVIVRCRKYKLGHPSHFHYLNQSKTYELEGVSNAEEYMKTRRAMDIVGISHEDQEAIFRTLAAILHLGNIEFTPGREHDSSVIKDQKSTFHLQTAADLFRCDVNLLLATLCTRTIQTREGSIVKALDCNAAVASRDALAKTVYSRLFDWLVDKINLSVGQDPDSRVQIGVLDIYGFECFRHNR